MVENCKNGKKLDEIGRILTNLVEIWPKFPQNKQFENFLKNFKKIQNNATN